MRKEKEYKLNYISDLKLIFTKKKFILSALNLAFLALIGNKKIKYHKDLLMWPDGIFSQKYLQVKKIPGFELISKIKIPSKIKKIVVLGDLNIPESDFLKNRFNKKIEHQKTKHGNIETIIKDLSIKLSDKNLYIITLPTPKQEQLAFHISKKIKNFKIICIGGGLAIASGSIERSPKIISNLNLEWAWRLRTDTKRRILRLFKTFAIYIYYSLFSKDFKFRFKKI